MRDAHHPPEDPPQANGEASLAGGAESASLALHKLIEDLLSEDRQARETASAALPMTDKRVILLLLERMVEGPEIRFTRGDEIIRSYGLEALPYLLGALKSHDPGLAKASGCALWRVKPEARDAAVESIVELLGDKASRHAAAWALFGIRPREALTALEERFPDPEFRVAALKALAGIAESDWLADPGTFPFNNDPILRLRAFALLICMKPQLGWRLAERILFPAVVDDRSEIRNEALSILRLLSPTEISKNLWSVETYLGTLGTSDRHLLAELYGLNAIGHELSEDELEVISELYRLRSLPRQRGPYIVQHPLVEIVVDALEARAAYAEEIVAALNLAHEPDITAARARVAQREEEQQAKDARVAGYFEVVSGLSSEDPWTAETAAAQLLQAQGEGVPAMIHALERTDSSALKKAILHILCRVRSFLEACDVAPAILRVARDSDAQCAEQAIITLGICCYDHPLSIPGLLQVIDERRDDDSAEIILNAVLSSFQLISAYSRKPLPQNAYAFAEAALDHDSLARRSRALDLLAHGTDVNPTTIRKIARFLVGSETSRTPLLAQAAGAFASIGSKALPVLLEMCLSDSTEDRAMGAAALAWVRDIRPAQLFPPILAADAARRGALLQAASSLVAKDADALDGITALLQDPDENTRVAGLDVLFKASTDIGAYADICLALHSDKSAAVREKAAYALGNCGASAEPLIEANCKSGADEVRLFVSRSLVQAGRSSPASAPLVRVALGMLHDDLAEVRRNIATSLGDFGAIQDERLLGLVGALEDKDRGVRESAAASIRIIDPGGQYSGARLLAMLDRGVDDIPVEAVTLLGRLRYTPALGRLSELGNSSNSVLRGIAREAVDVMLGRTNAANPYFNP
jgi:hypothetical protein